jgi:BirA family biotin operon repressor/biotin-[acetyl-CoA-carboxylase] ligase
LQSVDSTNAEAERVFDTLAGPTWIVAHAQTAARGRRGREWVNPKGNFAGTLVLPGIQDGANAAQHSFIAALALYDAFVAVSGRTDAFSLKWPNDVLLNGCKVAGILLETILRANQISGMMIGIGVNLKSAPSPDKVEPHAVHPTSLTALGVAQSPEEFLIPLADAYARYYAQHTTFGFPPIRDAWLARAARLGEVITARMPTEEITGTFETIDTQGNLELRTAQGLRRIAAADIYF